MVSVEKITLPLLAKTAVWVWLFLLQFCVSNQSMGVQEDALNKPWRPLPSGRLTLLQAGVLRWSLLPACILLSYYYGALWPAIMLSIGIIMNNELQFDSHWFTRNITNALGYFAFGSGACMIIAGKSIEIITA